MTRSFFKSVRITNTRQFYCINKFKSWGFIFYCMHSKHSDLRIFTHIPWKYSKNCTYTWATAHPSANLASFPVDSWIVLYKRNRCNNSRKDIFFYFTKKFENLFKNTCLQLFKLNIKLLFTKLKFNHSWTSGISMISSSPSKFQCHKVLFHVWGIPKIFFLFLCGNIQSEYYVF